MAEMQHQFQHTQVKPKGPVVVTNNRLIPCFILVDCIIAAGLVVLWYFLEFDPTNVFPVNVQTATCGDPDYSKPYTDPEDRLPEAVVYVMVFMVPFVVILFGEAALSIYQVKIDDYVHQEKTVKTCGIKIHPMLRRTLRFTGMHVLGGFVTWIIVDVGQIMIGRLTPHFLTICQPEGCPGDLLVIESNADCDVPDSCSTDDMVNCDYLNDARMSFPNLYAALSAYAAVYCGLYISSVFTITLTRLTRPFLVLGLLALAYMAGLDEVAAYQCFWTDILIGYIIGASVAGYLGYFALDYFKGKPQYNKNNIPTEMQDLIVMNPMHPVNKAALSNDPMMSRQQQQQPMKTTTGVETGPDRLSYMYDGSMGQVPHGKKPQDSFLHSPQNYLSPNGK